MLYIVDRLIKTTKPAETPVGGEVFWYPYLPISAAGDGPYFGILSSVFRNKLTWGDVWHVVDGLREWYAETGLYFGCSYAVEDSVRGNLGSGVVKRGKRVVANPKPRGGGVSSE